MTAVETLINTVPNGINPVGWRAAVLAVEDFATGNGLRGRVAKCTASAAFFCIGARLL